MREANSNNSFIGLPLEIKNIIYAMVLGGNTIAIRDPNNKEMGFTRRKDNFKLPHVVLKRPFSSLIEPNTVSDSLNLPWSECPAVRRFKINFLFVCKSISEESRLVMLSENEWFFGAPGSLVSFASMLRSVSTERGMQNTLAIRQVYLGLGWHSSQEWIEAFSYLGVRNLINKLFVKIETLPHGLNCSGHYIATSDGDLEEDLVEAVSATFPLLRSLTIVVDSFESQEANSTLNMKVDQAIQWQKRLLGGKQYG